MKHLKYFFFSDVHACDGTEKDDFSQKHEGGFAKDQSFINKLELIRTKVDKIVILGDLYELWQSTRDAILKAHAAFCHWVKFNTKKIKGNHDFETFAPDRMIFTTKSGKRVLAIHGHQSNPKMLKWYSRGFIFIVGKLEKWLPWLDEPEKWPRLYKLLPKKYRKVFEEKFHEVSGIEKDVGEWCKTFTGKYDIIICGHTHKQGSITYQNERGTITVLNVGHNTNGAFQGLLFDAENDRWEFV